MADQGLDLLDVRVERVLSWPEGSAQAVVLEREGKRFLIFVGPTEGAAVRRELDGERSERPMTHDLFDYAMRGFDVAVSRVAISALVNEVFCATVSLTQSAEPGRPRREVRLDARASDAIVLALKASVPLTVARRVFDAVEDRSDEIEKIAAAARGVAGDEAGDGTEASGDDDPGDDPDDVLDAGEESDEGPAAPPSDDDSSADDDEEDGADEDRDRPLRGPP
jgi:bifunctional DNase/RNase